MIGIGRGSKNSRRRFRMLDRSRHSTLLDGANDYAQSYATTRPDATIASRTYSFWAKASDTSSAARSTVFSHGAYYKSTFYFNWNLSRPLLYSNIGVYRYWDDNAAQDDGNWHHWMVYADATSSANHKLYIDGVLQGVNYTAAGTPAYHNTNGIFVGYGYSPQAGFFDGNLDEFAIFAGDATAHAATIYNHGSPADLTAFSPEHWWRMGDSGIGGGIILDQVTPTVGPELVVNGTFDATVSGGWDGWDNRTDAPAASQSGGVGILDSTSGGVVAAYQDVTVVVGKEYAVSVTAHYVPPATWTFIYVGDGTGGQYPAGGGYEYANIAPSTTTATWVKHVVATTTTLRIECVNEGSYGGGPGHFDNMSVKELSGTPLYLPNGGIVEIDNPDS